MRGKRLTNQESIIMHENEIMLDISVHVVEENIMRMKMNR